MCYSPRCGGTHTPLISALGRWTASQSQRSLGMLILRLQNSSSRNGPRCIPSTQLQGNLSCGCQVYKVHRHTHRKKSCIQKIGWGRGLALCFPFYLSLESKPSPKYLLVFYQLEFRQVNWEARRLGNFTSILRIGNNTHQSSGQKQMKNMVVWRSPARFPSFRFHVYLHCHLLEE